MAITTTPERTPVVFPAATADQAHKPPHVSWRALAPIAVTLLLALLPPPSGLALHAW